MRLLPLLLLALAGLSAGCKCDVVPDHQLTFEGVDATTGMPIAIALSEISDDAFCVTPTNAAPEPTTKCTVWRLFVDDGHDVIVSPDGYHAQTIKSPPVPEDACNDPNENVVTKLSFAPIVQ